MHWFANCGANQCPTGCTNSQDLQSGFDWGTFSAGNSCSGDTDSDYATGHVDCYFG